MSTTTIMDQFILFGDSITRQSFDPERSFSCGAALSYAYCRRLDVVNRGFSGYNTTQALQMLPHIMPSPQQAKVKLLAIFFGANDAKLPLSADGLEQYVSLEVFKNNMREIVRHPDIRAHHDIRVVLITPPPIEERKMMGTDAKPNRTAENAARYAAVVREIGKELKVPVLDLHTVMMLQATGGVPPKDGAPLPGSLSAPRNKFLEDCLEDGLHFTGKAYRILFDSLMAFIESHWPDHLPQNLPLFLPEWNDTKAWEKEFGGTSYLGSGRPL